jgi:hypothetical protein
MLGNILIETDHKDVSVGEGESHVCLTGWAVYRQGVGVCKDIVPGCHMATASVLVVAPTGIDTNTRIIKRQRCGEPRGELRLKTDRIGESLDQITGKQDKIDILSNDGLDNFVEDGSIDPIVPTS